MAPLHQHSKQGRDPIYRVKQFIEAYTTCNAGIVYKIRLNELLDAINRVPTVVMGSAR
jgi:hypothetical protein